MTTVEGLGNSAAGFHPIQGNPVLAAVPLEVTSATATASVSVSEATMHTCYIQGLSRCVPSSGGFWASRVLDQVERPAGWRRAEIYDLTIFVSVLRAVCGLSCQPVRLLHTGLRGGGAQRAAAGGSSQPPPHRRRLPGENMFGGSPVASRDFAGGN